MEPEICQKLKKHRLWNAFTRNCSTTGLHSPHRCVKHEHKSSLSLLSLMNPIRTVCALEQNSEPENSIQRLATRKPNIVVSDEEVRRYMEKETGRSRLHQLFSRSEDGRFHPDLENVMGSIQFCGLSVFIVTSVFGSRAAKEKFLAKNKHVKYETKFQFARAYNDALIIGGLKFGGRWGLKTILFSTLFLLTSQSIATYRNKSSVWEYIAGGMVTGAILRMNLGLKGFVAGGIIGGTLGSVGGTLVYLLLRGSNETQEQKHYWRIQNLLQKDKEYEQLFPSHKDRTSQDVEIAVKPQPA